MIAVGDIHGCYFSLQALLQQTKYCSKIYCLGDVLGKGAHSDKVLDWIIENSIPLVLGNHEIAWIKDYLIHTGALDQNRGDREDLAKLTTHPHAKQWFDYLIQQPFLIEKENCLLVHAAIWPSWTRELLIETATWLSAQLAADPVAWFQQVSPKSLYWRDDLLDAEKRYLAREIFTRCRYLTINGDLDLKHTQAPEDCDLMPWYECCQLGPVVFGHWAALKGRHLAHHYHLDGGCVYQGKLLAMDLRSKQRFEQQWVRKDE